MYAFAGTSPTWLWMSNVTYTYLSRTVKDSTGFLQYFRNISSISRSMAFSLLLEL